MKIRYFFKKIQDVKLTDYIEFFPMIAGIVLTPFYHNRFKNSWLICEEPEEARDNGYHFFKYMNIEHSDIESFYAIKKKSKDYSKVQSIGKIVEYGSVKHWILYFNTKYNISSQKGGKPNAAICALFELNHIFKPHNIFLQHGVIINDLEWLHSDKTVLDMFVTSTLPEQKFIQDTFGFEKSRIVLTGLPRFDNLHDFKCKKNRIVIMPTWRKWLRLNSEKNNSLDNEIKKSEFLGKWVDLLDSKELDLLIDKYNLEVIFYPHRHMQKDLDAFSHVNKKIIIGSSEDYEIQDLMKTSELMITDYSSVFFDMIYMKKPIIFYQFDEDEFRKFHYGKGYFDYHNNAFGNAYSEYQQVVNELERLIGQHYNVSSEYQKEHSMIFPYYDTHNSERIYEHLAKNGD